MDKQIILMNGPSSSGKSTLSRNLQTLIQEKCQLRFEVISIDDFMKIATNETIYEDDVYEINEELCTAALKELETADGIIIDHVITSPRIYQQLRDILDNYPIRTVRVTCPLEILREREIQRGDRCPGSAEASLTYLYPKEGYDLNLDTHAHSSLECAKKIHSLL